MSVDRPYYNRALKILQAAHEACFKAPDRDGLGMSTGPFSGVNETLGIVDELERENRRLRDTIDRLRLKLEGPLA